LYTAWCIHMAYTHGIAGWAASKKRIFKKTCMYSSPLSDRRRLCPRIRKRRRKRERERMQFSASESHGADSASGSSPIRRRACCPVDEGAPFRAPARKGCVCVMCVVCVCVMCVVCYVLHASYGHAHAQCRVRPHTHTGRERPGGGGPPGRGFGPRLRAAVCRSSALQAAPPSKTCYATVPQHVPHDTACPACCGSGVGHAVLYDSACHMCGVLCSVTLVVCSISYVP
jgi:hypothetical protein